MHHLLRRQIKRFLGNPEALPDQLRHLFEAISAVYEQEDLDRAMIERSLNIMSQELLERNEALSKELKERQATAEKLEQSLSILSTTLNATGDGILVVGNDRSIESYNEKFIEMWGIPRPLIEERSDIQILHFVSEQLAEPKKFLEVVERLCDSDEENVETLKFKDGRAFERYSQPRRIGDRKVGRVWSFQDITNRYEAEKKLDYMAHYDALTNLPNRHLLREKLKLAIRKALREHKSFALLFLDLDNFKTINDTLGHQAGDFVLQDIAARMLSCLRAVDTLARLGGDEYTIILEGLGTPAHAAKVAAKILKSLAAPFNIENREVFCTMSIGIAMFPGDTTDVDDLLKHADSAMYRAKENGKNNYQFYTDDMNSKVQDRLMLESKLRRALEKHEFILHYQPIFNIESGKVVGLEALIRWIDLELGITSPARFIPILEETGMIVDVGLWVIREACLFNKSLQTSGVADNLLMSVNLSPRQFRQKELVSQIQGILNLTGLDTKYLNLEITENVLADPQLAHAVLTQMRALGLSLSIDDFGTGYSSLSSLKRFPINTLKIDQSFLQDIPTDKHTAAITNAIIVLGQSLKMKIIAEGVETRDQFEYLKQQGCDEAQGFLLATPMPEKELVPWLQKNVHSVLFPRNDKVLQSKNQPR